MAIHDVEVRGGLKRLNVRPNADDRVQQRMAQGTVQIQNKVEGQTGGSIRFEEGAIIINDGTNDRVLIGYQSGGF